MNRDTTSACEKDDDVDAQQTGKRQCREKTPHPKTANKNMQCITSNMTTKHHHSHQLPAGSIPSPSIVSDASASVGGSLEFFVGDSPSPDIFPIFCSEGKRWNGCKGTTKGIR